MGRKIDLNKKTNRNNNIRRPNQYHHNRNRYNQQSTEEDGVERARQSAIPSERNNKNKNRKTNNQKATITTAKGKSMPKIPTSAKIILGASVVILPLAVLFLVILMACGISLTGVGGTISFGRSPSLSFGEHYTPQIQDVIVIFETQNEDGTWQVTNSKTYSIEDYVAGVVYAKYGNTGNTELYKLAAIEARTYVLTNVTEDGTISNRNQQFIDITKDSSESVQQIYDAIRKTNGKVIHKNGKLYSNEQDEFCYISKTDSYYTLYQQNQQIPVSWAESNISEYTYLNCPCNLNDASKTECWQDGVWQDGGTGEGISKYGALYLTQELGYTYDEVIKYYYGDTVSIGSSSFISSIAGLEIKNTKKANTLKEPLGQYLNSKGSSIEDMNSYIHDSVESVGAGTRAGVVTAAVSMINYLYDNFNLKLPYYWGGAHQKVGIPSSFGTYEPSATSRGGNTFYYKSFDCSGFVSWAIKNGGFNIDRTTSSGFDRKFSKDSCDIEKTSCIGQPGDLINSANDHVQLIIAVDEDAGKYYIAESTGAGVVMQERKMHTRSTTGKLTKIIHMDNYYNNSSNINSNY